MKLEPHEVLFVGDSPSDLLAAHAAGSNGVAALWDLMAKREELAPHKPHHWAETPHRVWEIFSGVRSV
jgi:phosphoglycolate phosphatase-like HAD superfamily hydrolase